MSVLKTYHPKIDDICEFEIVKPHIVCKDPLRRCCRCKVARWDDMAICPICGANYLEDFRNTSVLHTCKWEGE